MERKRNYFKEEKVTENTVNNLSLLYALGYTCKRKYTKYTSKNGHKNTRKILLIYDKQGEELIDTIARIDLFEWLQMRHNLRLVEKKESPFELEHLKVTI